MLNRCGLLATFAVTCDHRFGAIKVPGLTCSTVRDNLLLTGWWFLRNGA